MDKPFETNAFFVGGAGMFVEFHDIVKPVYLYAVMDMLISNISYGLPIEMLRDFSIASILEWYKYRRYRNPLQQLDWQHKLPKEKLDEVMNAILTDTSVYTLAPSLNIGLFLDVYRSQHMTFPWFIYSEEYEDGIKESCDILFGSIPHKYVHGDLRNAIKKCDQNYTYIFSDIEKIEPVSEILHGTFSNILVASDYRYNYKDNFRTMKYNLQEVMSKHPFVRIATTTAMDLDAMGNSFDNLINYEGEEDDE